MSLRRFVINALLVVFVSFIGYAEVSDETEPNQLDPSEVGYDFEIDGIYYKKLGGDSVSTSQGDKEYTGVVVIPDEVEYDNVIYRVTKVSGFKWSPYVTEVTIPKHTRIISAFYGASSKMEGGPGIKSVMAEGDGTTEEDDDSHTSVVPLLSSLKKVYFNADSCGKAFYSIHTTSSLGGGYVGYQSIFPYTLDEIEFGSNVVSIPEGLLYRCRQIQSLTIPESVRHIGNFIIDSAVDNLTECNILSRDLQRIGWLPKDQSCVELGKDFHTYPCGFENYKVWNLSSYENRKRNSNLFHEFIGLKSKDGETVTLPKWVKKIAPNAFSTFGYKININIPEHITEIAEKSFEGCVDIEEITIPSTITSIGASAFKGCKSLKTVTYNVVDCEIKAQDKIFESCDSLTKVVFGDSVKIIPNYILRDSKNLTTVELGDLVSEIREFAFAGTGIKEITLPASLELIENYAFNNCASLKKIVFNAPNCTLNRQSFSDCKSLSDITFGPQVKRIPKYCFEGLKGLHYFEFPETVTEIGDYAFRESGIKEITIPRWITSIGVAAFNKCDSLTTITYDIPNITGIGRPFSECKSLQKVVIGDNVVSVPANLFSDFTTLTEIVLSNSLEEIQEFAFSRSRPKELTLPVNLTYIGGQAFSGNPDLKLLRYNAKNCTVSEDHLPPFIGTSNFVIEFGPEATVIPSRLFASCNGIEEITIPSHIKGLGYYAFGDCEKLTTVYFNANDCEIIPSKTGGVTVFGLNSNNIKKLVIGENVKKIPNYLMYWCSKLTDVTIPEWVEEIGACAFYNAKITELTIPKNVKRIGDCAFGACDSLVTLHFNAENCEYFSEQADDNLGVFAQCKSLANVKFGEDVTKIPFGLLYSCFKLTEIEIPDKVTEIGEKAFFAAKITELNIPDSVVKIGAKAFGNCNGIKTLNLGKSVAEIGSGAFMPCNVTKVTSLNPTPPVMPDDAFYPTFYKTATLTVPKESLNLYRVASGWKNFMNFATGLDNISVEEESEVPAFYNLQGVKVENPEKGIYIKRLAGKTSKVIIK